ncbi:hypothetical protein EMIT040CA3_160002 [Bacillus pseudomycoides]
MKKRNLIAAKYEMYDAYITLLLLSKNSNIYALS